MTRPVRPETSDRLLDQVARVQRDTQQPSVVAGVVRDGEIAWHAALGSTTGGPEPGTDMQYRIGSITKTVTAVLVMQCRDEGLIDLADPVGSLLGDVPFGATSLRQLLSHTGGLPAEPAGEWWERRDGRSGFDALAAEVRDQQIVLPPGQQVHYSNLAYALLGEVVVQRRGQPWYDAARERVLDPLGMTRTTFHPQTPHACGYSVHPWSGRLADEPHTDTGAMAPAGQLWSTVADLGRYLAFWLRPDDTVLAATTAAEMRIPAGGSPAGLDSAYGLGLWAGTPKSHLLFGHGGSMPGFLAGIAVDPEQGAGAVALSNATVGDTPALSYSLLAVLAATEPRRPSPWQPEPALPGADELLGPWYWGNTPFALLVREGHLVLQGSNSSRVSRFLPAGADRWRGLDQYFTGETLAVVRAPDGSIESLDLATYRLTRTPYGS